MTATYPVTGRRMTYVDLFDQTEVWIDGHGVVHPIDSMSETYIENVMAYLRRHADGYHLGVGLSLCAIDVVGTQAEYDLDAAVSEFGRTEPLVWLRETPLYQALGKRLLRLREAEGGRRNAWFARQRRRGVSV